MGAEAVTHIHFIGIGGIGMSGIARIYLSRGIKVSGSDLKKSVITDELSDLGAKIFLGHDKENISGAQVVVYSSAIKEDNPEYALAKETGIRLIKRAQALAELMQGKTVITVTGSHGKTTTTSLISYLLIEAGLCPTVVIGGILNNIKKNSCPGSGDLFVAEADESDGSFLYYNPKYSIITNIDYEHLDYYKDFKSELAAFKEFISHTDKNGCLFCCSDDHNLINLLKDYSGQYVLFGLNDFSHVYAKDIKVDGLSSEFDVFYNSRFIDRFYLSLGGKHNVSNALSVIAVGLKLNIDVEFIKKALRDYKGAGRRIEVKYKDSDITVIDDYAHHPTEIKSTLEAVKSLRSKRIIAVFQPHRFTRTQLLMDDFASSFGGVDLSIITGIYAASEKEIPGVTSESIVEKINERFGKNKAVFIPKEKIVDRIMETKKPGDIIITLGAGDIAKVCDELVERIKRKI